MPYKQLTVILYPVKCSCDLEIVKSCQKLLILYLLALLWFTLYMVEIILVCVFLLTGNIGMSHLFHCLVF